MLLNVLFPHVTASPALRRYMPGTATAALLNAPVTIGLLAHAFREGYIEPRAFLIFSPIFVIAIVAFHTRAVSDRSLVQRKAVAITKQDCYPARGPSEAQTAYTRVRFPLPQCAVDPKPPFGRRLAFLQVKRSIRPLISERRPEMTSVRFCP